jgi:MATE family multidrug resistance protein
MQASAPIGDRKAGGLEGAPADGRTMLRLALPATVASVSVPLVGIVNTAVIGSLGDASLIGGVAIATIVFNVVFFTLNFFRSGVVGLTAQALGELDRVEVGAVVLRGCAIAFATGLLLLALGPMIGAVGLGAMGATGEVGAAASTYFDIRILSAPFLLVHYVVLGWVLGRGEAFLALLLEAVLNGTNIVLSIHLALSLSLGVEGVALATVYSEILAAGLGLAIVALKLKAGSRPHFRQVLDGARIRRMLSLNVDIMVRSLTLFLVTAIFTRQGTQFGAAVLAANAILLSMFQFAGAFLDGIATAAEQMSGRAVGAQNLSAFRRTVAMALAASAGVAIMLSLTLVVAGPSFLYLMTASDDVRAVARDYLLWVAAAPLLIAVAFQMDGIFIGATWSRDIRNMMLLSAAVFIGLLVLLPATNHALWAAYLGFLGARSALFYARIRSLTPGTFHRGPAAGNAIGNGAAA